MSGRISLWVVAGACLLARFLTREPLLSTALEVTAGIAAFSAGYLHKRHLLYALSFTLAVSGVAFFVYGTHVLWIFAGWEAVSVAGWLLIAFGRGISTRSLNAALIAFLTNRLGDVFWLAGAFSEGQFIAGIWIGALVKAGVFPFTFWLIQAMFAPVPVSALLHSAVIVGLGAYLPLKYPSLTGGAPLPEWGLSLLWSAGILAGMGAALSRSAKATLAWTTAAHLSIVLLLSDDTESARVYLLHHSYLKAALFLLLGLAQKSGGFSLPLTAGWMIGAFLLFTAGPFSEPFILLIEGLTALALGRAWRRTGTQGRFSPGLSLLLMVPTALIVRSLILNAEYLHLSWESLLLFTGFAVGMVYRGSFAMRLDRLPGYGTAFILRMWIHVSRALSHIDDHLQLILNRVADTVVHGGAAFARGEAWVAHTGWRTLARYVRQGLAVIGTEGARLSYGRALSWGFLVTLLVSMLWKVLR